jgi:5-methylcytosine-specific restriction endonuclease McrA
MLTQRKVLVLNRQWRAIAVWTLAKAFVKLCGTYKDGTPKARIIDCVNDFRAMTWEDWQKLRPHDNYCKECSKLLDQDQIEDGKCKVHKCKLGEDGLKSVNAIFRVPKIIVLSRYDKLPRQKVNYNRRAIYRRDDFTCQYCGRKRPTSELSLDHVFPKSKGGKSDWENVVVACTDCNAKKADRTLKEAGLKLLKQPKKPEYNFYPGDIWVKEWSNFISEAYWSVTLENDMGE